MPAPDPLATLARLRRLETDRARRLLAERLDRAAVAERVAAAASAAIAAEAAAAEHPADYGAWLVRGLADRDRTRHLQDLARHSEAEARQGLAESRAAERAVEILAAERARAQARARARAEQAHLDDRSAARAAGLAG